MPSCNNKAILGVIKKVGQPSLIRYTIDPFDNFFVEIYHSVFWILLACLVNALSGHYMFSQMKVDEGKTIERGGRLKDYLVKISESIHIQLFLVVKYGRVVKDGVSVGARRAL